jgi:hypothetical protein
MKNLCPLYVVALTVISLAACGRGSSENSRTQPSKDFQNKPVVESTAKSFTVNGKKLSPAMSDAEILLVFDIDQAAAKSTRSHGPDGYTMSYSSGGQIVYITRSAVSGLNVMASGPIKGDWQLGKP